MAGLWERRSQPGAAGLAGHMASAVATLADATDSGGGELADGERRAGDRLEQLEELAAALCGAVTRHDVARIAVEHTRAALAARATGLWAAQDDDGAALLYGAGFGPEQGACFARIALGRPAPADDGPTAPEALRVLTRAELDERHPGVVPASSEVQAVACAAMEVDGRCVGTLSFSFDVGDPLASEDQAFLLIAARMGAQALERARLHEQAQQAIRSREDVVAVVSHDLKNPLNAILMSSELLRRCASDPARVRHHADAIERSVNRMRNLVRDLLDLARLEAGRFTLERQPIDVGALAADAVAVIQPLAQAKQLVVEDDTAPVSGVRAFCDRERVMQVLSNLLGNAIAFTPPEGRVTVRARPAASDVVVAVTDTGPGIPEHEQELVFDRFWKSRSSGQGTGLGLSIAKGVVEAHGGRIWVESRPGAGATFLFTLPLESC